MANCSHRQPLPEFAEIATNLFHKISRDLIRLLFEKSSKRKVAFQAPAHFGEVGDSAKSFG